MNANTTKGKWTAIKRDNSWGSIFYHYADEKPDPHAGLELKKGMEVEVRWPDGEVSKERLGYSAYTYMFSEMGHSYPVTQYYFHVIYNVHGVQDVHVPLEKLELRKGAIVWQDGHD